MKCTRSRRGLQLISCLAAALTVAACNETEPTVPPDTRDIGRPDFGMPDFGMRTDGGPRDSGDGGDVGTSDQGPDQGDAIDFDRFLVMGAYDQELAITTSVDPPGVGAARIRWAQAAASPGDFVVRLIGYQLVATGDITNRDFYFDVCTDDSGSCLGAGDLVPNTNGESLVATIESSMNARAGLVIGTALSGVTDILDVTRTLSLSGTFDLRSMPTEAGSLGVANSFTSSSASATYSGSTSELLLPTSTSSVFAAALVGEGGSTPGLTTDTATIDVPMSILVAELWTRVAFDQALGVASLSAFFTAYVDCDAATLLTTPCENLTAEILASTPGSPSARLLAWQSAAGIDDQALSVSLPAAADCAPVFDGLELQSFDCASDATWAPAGANQAATARFVVARP